MSILMTSTCIYCSFVDMLDHYSNDLHEGPQSDASDKFLMEQIEIPEEGKLIALPNFVRGEFDEYPDDKHMHFTARVVDILDHYSNDLHEGPQSDASDKFLMEQIEILEEGKLIALPNFMSRTILLLS